MQFIKTKTKSKITFETITGRYKQFWDLTRVEFDNEICTINYKVKGEKEERETIVLLDKIVSYAFHD